MKIAFISLLLVIASPSMYAGDLYSPKQRGSDRAQTKLIKDKHRFKHRFGNKFARKREDFREQHLSTNPATKQELLAKSTLKSKQRRGKA